jgi:hypothetical protein
MVRLRSVIPLADTDTVESRISRQEAAAITAHDQTWMDIRGLTRALLIGRPAE